MCSQNITYVLLEYNTYCYFETLRESLFVWALAIVKSI